MKKIIIVAAVGFGLITLPALAQNNVPSQEMKKDLRKGLKQERADYREDFKEAQKDLKEARKDLKEEIQAKREAAEVDKKADKERLKTASPSERIKIKEEMKANADKLRKENKNKREEFQKKRDGTVSAFREKVKDVKERARRINAFSRVSVVTNRFRALDARYSNIIERIESQFLKIKEEGKDTSALEQSLTDIKVKKEGLSKLLEEFKSKAIVIIEQGEKEAVKKEIRMAVEKLEESGKDIKEQLKTLTENMKALHNEKPAASTPSSN